MLTPLGIFIPFRLPQGNLNSVFAFQRAMDTIFRSSLKLEELLIWIDTPETSVKMQMSRSS